ncbi:hypothetical protein B1987_20100 [Mycobacterium kansasii]|nr:hypothetical protein B1987_20100 [Mycobacterium kansasii]
MFRFIYRAALSTALAATATLCSTEFAGTANAVAQPSLMPTYFWCPGQPFDPSWGPNWDPNDCHDDNRYFPGLQDQPPIYDDPDDAPPPPAAGGGG